MNNTSLVFRLLYPVRHVNLVPQNGTMYGYIEVIRIFDICCVCFVKWGVCFQILEIRKYHSVTKYVSRLVKKMSPMDSSPNPPFSHVHLTGTKFSFTI